jgi:hypothetical protein
MDILESSLSFSSQRLTVQQLERQESLRVWQDTAMPGQRGQSVGTPGRKVGHDRVTLSPGAAARADSHTAGQQALEPKTQVLVSVIEALTGKKVELVDPGELTGSGPEATAGELEGTEGHAVEPSGDEDEATSQGFESTVSQTYRETERTSLSIQGQVATSDGASIDVDIELSMSRTFVQTQTASLSRGELQDPLVINLEQTAAQLTEQRFQFDIDVDGSDERIAFPEVGSGFLSLDRNGDGTVTDGSELFGPSTGQGFEELAEHDQDGDSWIDRADPVFDRLTIWTKNEQGQDELFSLAQAGVSAIHLGRVPSLFQLQDATQTLQGRIASTGLYIDHNAQAGTIQELDLSV